MSEVPITIAPKQSDLPRSSTEGRSLEVSVTDGFDMNLPGLSRPSGPPPIKAVAQSQT